MKSTELLDEILIIHAYVKIIRKSLAHEGLVQNGGFQDHYSEFLLDLEEKIWCIYEQIEEKEFQKGEF